MSNVATETNRTITVLSPRGAPEKALSLPNGIKWSELKKEVEKHYSLDKMKAVESIGSHTLEHPNAIVPDGDFDLYLLQLRSKSGAKAAKKAAKKAAPKKAAKAAKKEVVAKKAATKSPKKAAKAVATAKPARSPRKKAEVEPEPVAPVLTLAEKQRKARELANGFNDLYSGGGF